jgi:hypothetical protein
MITVRVVLLIAAFVCLLLSALSISAPRINLQSLGLCLWVLAVLIG